MRLSITPTDVFVDVKLDPRGHRVWVGTDERGTAVHVLVAGVGVDFDASQVEIGPFEDELLQADVALGEAVDGP